MTDAAELSRRIALRTAGAWSLGVFSLALLCIVVAWQGSDAQVEGELRAHALAAYGMAWFDDDGFHDEVLLKEPALFEGDVTLSIASPAETVFGPPVPTELVLQAMQRDDEVWQEDDGRLVLAIPTFDERDQVCGAVVASVPLGPIRRGSLRFAGATLAAALGLTLIGLVVSRRLSLSILAALEESIRERERILAGAAHELRTPLATLQAVVEASGPDDAPQALAQVGETVRATSGMVHRLLTWSQLAHSTPKLQPVRLDLLVEVCLDEADAFDAEPWVVRGDPELIEVAVRNLVANARVHGGGLRAVTVRGGRVEVLDNGPGVPQDMLAPFTKGPKSPGTGLGLALVKRIAARHGGRLELAPVVALVLPGGGPA